VGSEDIQVSVLKALRTMYQLTSSVQSVTTTIHDKPTYSLIICRDPQAPIRIGTELGN